MKRFVKQVLLLIWSIIRRDTASKVVFYHDIGKKYTPMGTDARVFFEHMRVIARENRWSGRHGEHVVAFDDGFRGVWEHRNELEKIVGAGIKVIVFVAVRLVGEPGYLTWDEIEALNCEYGIDFQCHTWSHQTLVGPMIDESPIEERTEAWYWRELVESKDELERRLGKKITGICFPAGLFSQGVIERCRKAGYSQLYASYPGNIPGDNSLIIPRNLVQDLCPIAFKAALRGGLIVFEKRYRNLHYVRN